MEKWIYFVEFELVIKHGSSAPPTSQTGRYYVLSIGAMTITSQQRVSSGHWANERNPISNSIVDLWWNLYNSCSAGGDIILGTCMDNKCVVIKYRHCSVVGWNIFHVARNRRAKESRLVSTLGVQAGWLTPKCFRGLLFLSWTRTGVFDIAYWK